MHGQFIGPSNQLMLVLVASTCSMMLLPSPRLLLHDLCAGRPSPRASPPVASASLWSYVYDIGCFQCNDVSMGCLHSQHGYLSGLFLTLRLSASALSLYVS